MSLWCIYMNINHMIWWCHFLQFVSHYYRHYIVVVDVAWNNYFLVSHYYILLQSSTVAMALLDIFKIIHPPAILQPDNGREFSGIAHKDLPVLTEFEVEQVHQILQFHLSFMYASYLGRKIMITCFTTSFCAANEVVCANVGMQMCCWHVARMQNDNREC